MASHQSLLQSRRFITILFGGTVLLLFYYLLIPFDAHSSHSGTSAYQPETQGNNIIKKNVAAIIENRNLDQVLPLILHFSAVLGRDWPIFLFTSHTALPDSAPFKRLIDEHQITVRFLPPDLDFTNRLDVSGFLTRPWLWDQLEPAKHVLIFQADSILCSYSPLRVDDFLKYDFVGAPIHENYGEGYFRDGEARVIARLLDGGAMVLATGGGAFMREETRQRIQEKAVSIWLKADVDIIMRRVRRRADRPLLQTADPTGTVTRLLSEPEPVYQHADLTIWSRDVPHDRIVDDCVEALYAHLHAPTDVAASNDPTGDLASDPTSAVGALR